MKYQIFIALLVGVGMSSLAFADESPLMGVTPNCVYLEEEQWNGTRISEVCRWDAFVPKHPDEITSGPPDPEPDPMVECVEPQVLYDGQCVFPQQKVPTDDPVIVDEDKEDETEELTDREELIKDNTERACEASEKDPEDLLKYDLCRSWEEAGECERGINESAPVQTNEFFLTTDFILSQWRHHDYSVTSTLVVLTSANLECFYQRTILEPITLGPRYDNLAKADAVIDLDHQERAADIFQPIHPLELTPAVHATSQQVATDALCANRNYISAWEDYGCPHARVQVYDGVGLNVGGENVVEHLKFLEDEAAYRLPVIKGWFKVGECYPEDTCEWLLEIP